jgi:hypothetical protein
MDLQLYYGPILVGEVSDVFDHQGTWFGTLRPALSADRDPTERRICEFITFCEDFYARCREDRDADASEYDRFSDLFTPGSWRVQAPDGTASEIRDAPNFIGGGEISWIDASSVATADTVHRRRGRRRGMT